MGKRLNKSYNKIVIEFLSERPVAYIPTLGRIAGSAIAGLFLSQLLFWWEKGWKENQVYKTIAEIEKEICLNRSEQDRAIKIWARLGILEKKLEGIPPIRHFTIKMNRLAELLKRAKQMPESAKYRSKSA